MHNIEFDVAEVLEFDYTYQYIDPSTNPNAANNLFAIRCRSCGSYFNLDPFIAKPGDINIKRIPLVGEYVLIYRTYNQNATNNNRKSQSWYYLSTIDLQSNIHANILPGISKRQSQSEIDNTRPGKTFDFRTISPLQPYEGDLLLEGRWGNSIRFGSTIDLYGTQNHYHVPVPWSGKYTGTGDQGDPIIILSNGRKNLSNKQFVAENIQNDQSSLYLTSTQKLPAFKLNNVIRTSDSETSFNGSQFLGTADRVTLKSKSDIIVLDSNSAVEINTPLLSIGKTSDKEFGLHSEQVKELFDEIIDVLSFGLLAGGSVPVTINPAILPKFQQSVEEIKRKIDNKLIRQDKAK